MFFFDRLSAEGEPLEDKKSNETNANIAPEATVALDTNEITKASKEYEHKILIKPVADAMKTEFNLYMIGDNPVRMEVDIRDAYIAPSTGTNTLTADFRLISQNTNTVLTQKYGVTVKHNTTGNRAYYGGSLAAVLIATAIDAAASAAISQIGKDKRYEKMSGEYAKSIRNWIAPDFETEKSKAHEEKNERDNAVSRTS